jgi:protein involved in temperature-dependent protein secretion
MTVEQAIEQGDFVGALSLLEAQLRVAPAPGAHFLCFELKALVEDFAGADAQLDELERLAPDSAGAVVEFRKCLEAAAARATRRDDPEQAGRRAAFTPPPPHSHRYVEAATLHARRDHAAAAQVLADARARTPPLAGSLTFVDGPAMEFADITDSDDLTGPHLECVGKNGLLDLPLHSITAIEFLPGRGYQDVLWKPARITDSHGQANVRVFSLYTGSGRHDEAMVRTGGVTIWDHECGYAIGFGLRDLKLDGQTMVGINRVQRIDLYPARS